MLEQNNFTNNNNKYELYTLNENEINISPMNGLLCLVKKIV